MRVLIACEYTGTERDAFIAAGHDAISCDILPTEKPGPHHQGDVRDLMGERWDLVIAHPPCTYLSNSGVRWLYSDPTRWQRMVEGAAFFREMFGFNTAALAVENPIQHRWAKLAHGQGDPTQTVQPWQFGHPESKATCLWLRGLPPLVATGDARAEMATLPKSQTQRIWYASPGADRGKVRSAAYSGIAAAMATQWPAFLAGSGRDTPVIRSTT